VGRTLPRLDLVGVDLVGTGPPTAIFLIRVHDRFPPTGLADITDVTSTGTLQAAAGRYQPAFDTHAERCGLTA
jgi:hypothetical protein